MTSPRPSTTPRFGARSVAVAAGLYALLLAAAWGAAALWPDWCGIPWIGTAGADVALGLVAGVAIAAASWPFALGTRAGRRLTARLGRGVRGMPWWAVPVLALSAGLAEEAVFRGVLWTLAAALGGDGVALAVTTLLFAAAHGAFLPPLAAWSVFALLAGVGLGVLRIHTGALLAPVVAHAVIDAVNLPLLLRFRAREGDA
jgi:hypothetical protein